MTGPTPKPWIDAIHPYTPGRSVASGVERPVKLSSNENPLGTSPAAQRALAEAQGGLSRYPDPRSTALREAIGVRYGLDPERIICGTGSDELLHLAAGAFAGVGDEVLYVRYGFSVYPIAARRVGAEPVEAPDTDYATNVDALLEAV
ncbi:MAG: histidinol-phosphate transaminase, partial [Parasphingopyxis sp.]|uniref:aminotransferase class I/II-fold pyridoxal phosphate-dependent enzyme n=1 Tax=Parasphingopyxis sp. TaxID=1920299 RepID=UPI0032EF1BD2